MEPPTPEKTQRKPNHTQATRIWRILCCGCGFCGGEARREARLVKKVKKAMGPAIELEEKMIQTNSLGARVRGLLYANASAIFVSRRIC